MSDRDLDLKLRISADSTGGAVREIGALGAEVAALGGDASKTNGEAAVLARQLDDLARTGQLVNSFKAAGAEVQETAARLGDLQTKTRAAGEQQAILDGNLLKTRAALTQVADASSELAADVQRANLVVVQAEEAHAELSARVRQGVTDSAAFGRAQADAAAQVSQAQRALERSETSVQVNSRSIADLSGRLETARAAQRDLTNQVIAADAPSAALTARHQRATERVEELQARLAIAKVRFSDLTAEVGRQQGALAGAESEYSSAGDAAARQASHVDDLRQQLALAKTELDRKSAALVDQRQALRDVSATEVELERAVRSDEAALAKNRQEVERLTGSVRTAETALEQQQQRLRQSELSLRAAGVDVSNLSAEERRLQTQAVLTNVAMEDLRRGIAGQRDELVEAASKTRQLEDAQKRTQTSSETLGGGLTNLARGVLAYTGVTLGTHLVGELANQADAVRNVESRLRLATQSQEEFNIAQQGLLRIANDARTSYNETADLYARVIRSTKELNLTQQQQLDVTESISKSLALSGAGTQAQEAALRQLGQALSSNVLRGDEFNSVMEQAPRLAQALAAGLHVTTGELRELAEQGKLTSAQVITALQSQGGAIRSEFAQLDPTINGVIVKIRNNWGQALAEFDKTNGVSERAIAALSAVAENMDELIQLATLAGNVTVAALGVKGVLAITSYADGLRKAEISAAALGAAVKNIGLPLALGLVLEYADDLGELAAKWTGVDDAARKAAENRRTQVQAEIDQQTAVVAGYLKYANVRIKAGEEIAKLSDEEREAYREALANRLVLENAERRRANLMNELGTATEAQVAAETAGYREIKAALEGIDNVQKGVLGQVSERAKRLAADFADVGADIGKVANEDLANLAARAAADLPTAQALANQLGAEFVGTGRAVGEAGQEIVKRFSEANATVRSLQATLDALRAEQLRRLGVDAAAVLTGIDTQARSLLTTFDSLAADGATDARLIKAAFEELLKKLDTPEELEALKVSLASVKNPAFDAADAVAEIEKKLKDVEAAADPAAQKLADAFKAFGIDTKREIETNAKEMEAAFLSVVASGQATAAGLRKAFEEYAKAQIEAGKPITAQTEEQRQIVEALKGGYNQLRDISRASGAAAAEGHRSAASAATEEFNSVAALINARVRLSAADQQRIKDIQAESDALRERNSLANDANRINNLANVSASAASINGRGAVGFGQDGINKLREIEAEIERAVSAGRIAADALSETKIDSPDDIREALRQASQARGQATALNTVTGSQASEARSLAADLERGAAALERAVERYQQAGLESGEATTVNSGTALGQNQIVFQPNPTTPAETPAQLPATNQTVNLNISINGSAAVPLQGSQQAIDQLLQLLEAAGLNATLGT